jgi:hypothetical protein
MPFEDNRPGAIETWHRSGSVRCQNPGEYWSSCFDCLPAVKYIIHRTVLMVRACLCCCPQAMKGLTLATRSSPAERRLDPRQLRFASPPSQLRRASGAPPLPSPPGSGGSSGAQLSRAATGPRSWPGRSSGPGAAAAGRCREHDRRWTVEEAVPE